MDVYQLKREYGRDLRFWGAVGVQQLMPFGTPEMIRNEVRRLKNELGRGGGFVLSTSKPISNPVPPVNAMAYFEAAMEK